MTFYKASVGSKKKDAKKEPREVLSQGDGSWLSYLQMDNRVFWKHTDPICKWREVTEDYLLPSDSSLRPDSLSMQQGKLDEAEVKKSALE